MAEIMHVKLADLLAPAPRGDRALQAIAQACDDRHSVFGVFMVDGGSPGLRNRTVSLFRTILETLALDILQIAPTRAFEEALTQLNKALLEDQAETHPPYPEIQAVIGIRVDQQLFFSGCGSLTTLYLRKTAERRFSIYELAEQFSPPAGTVDSRPFSNILDGDLQPGDVFYIGTPIAPQALKTDAFHDILVTLPPAGALSRLRQYCPPQDGYAGVSIAAQVERGLFSGLRPKNGAAVNSLQELQRLNDKTSDILGDLTQNSPLPAPGRRDITAYFLRIGTLFQRLGAALRLGFGFILKISKNKGSGTSLGLVSRRNITIGLGLGLLVVGVLLISRLNNDKAAASEAFAAQLASVESQISSAEASLLYKNYADAQRFTGEAEALLLTIVGTTTDQKDRIVDLRERLNKIASLAKGETAITPELVTTAPQPLVSLGRLTTGPIAVTTSSQVLRFNSLTRTLEPVGADNASPATAIPGTLQAEAATALFLGTNNRLFRIDPTLATTTEVPSSFESLSTVADIALYNSTLYSLLPATDQILKARPSIAGFEAGTPWIISQEQPLTEARALAIDGDMYVVTAKTVRKFRQGRELPWTTSVTLVNPLDAWTDPASSNIYILDAGNKRIVVINKETGAVAGQYLHDDLGNAIGFLVDEAQKRITFATRDSLFDFTPDHLLQ
jgi:hypothetical protein